MPRHITHQMAAHAYDGLRLHFASFPSTAKEAKLNEAQTSAFFDSYYACTGQPRPTNQQVRRCANCDSRKMARLLVESYTLWLRQNNLRWGHDPHTFLATHP